MVCCSRCPGDPGGRFKAGKTGCVIPPSPASENLPGPSRHRQTEQGETRLPAPGLSRKAKTKKGHVQPGSSRRSPAVPLARGLFWTADAASCARCVPSTSLSETPLLVIRRPVVTPRLSLGTSPTPQCVRDGATGHPPAISCPPSTPTNNPQDADKLTSKDPPSEADLIVITSTCRRSSCLISFPLHLEIRPAFAWSSLTTSLSTQSCLCLHI